jgi:hypothetical protein
VSARIVVRRANRDDGAMQDMRQGFCPLCGHNEVIEASATDFVGDAGPTRPMSVTHEIGWGGVKHIGVFDTYVCRRCGFTQWFARNPDGIPIGEGHATRLIQGTRTESGPYR